jgi:biotin carboxyl carrier protein
MDKSPFSVTVNENTLSVSPESIENLDSVEVKDGYFHILHDNKAYKAELIEANYSEKAFLVKVNGNSYTIKVADKYDRLIKQIGLTIGGSQKLNTIKSPMPGLVLQINVEEGQQVQKGDTLLILEAMKMENVIKAPADAIVKAIQVSKGDAIEKGQLLIEFNL